MSYPKLRVGFIGAGGNTRARHLPGFRACKNVELVAVANRSLESALKISIEWNLHRAEENWLSIIQAQDIDVVCIGTWPSTHAQITTAALSAGKHVLCEARMAANFEQAGQMLAAETANPHLAAYIVPAPFTLSHDQLARQILSSGQMGKPVKVVVDQRNGMFLNREGPPPWRLLRQHSGVNMLTLGIYYETLQRWLGTDATPTHAYAFRRSVSANHLWREVDLPEFLQVAAVYPALDNCPLEMHLSAIHEEEPTNFISIECENGTLFWDGTTNTLRILSKDKQPLTEFPPPQSDPWRVEEEFIEAVRAKIENRPFHPQQLTTFRLGAAYMQFTEAVFKLIESKF